MHDIYTAQHTARAMMRHVPQSIECPSIFHTRQTFQSESQVPESRLVFTETCLSTIRSSNARTQVAGLESQGPALQTASRSATAASRPDYRFPISLRYTTISSGIFDL